MVTRSFAWITALLVTVGNRLQAGEFFALPEVDEGDALRRAPHLANFAHPRTDQDAARGDEHDFVVCRGESGCHHLAVSRRGLDGDHPLRAAPVP